MIPSFTSENPKIASGVAVALDAEGIHAGEHRVIAVLRGALAAALTPLRAAGEALDEEGFGPYVDFLAAAGLDGLLALGTTGEGFLLPFEQRRRAAELFVEAARGRHPPKPIPCNSLLQGIEGWGSFAVAVHVGAQSTEETVELAAHAAGIG